MTVGILGYLRPRGLAYDGMAIRDALRRAPPVEVSIFPVRDLYRVQRRLSRGRRVRPVRPAAGFAVPEAERKRHLLAWMGGLDTLFTLEALPRTLARAARAAGVRHVHVPNLEWIPDRPSAREDLAIPDCVIAKTRFAERTLRAWGLENLRAVPWSVPLLAEVRAPTASPVRFLHVCGVGSSLEAKNPEAVLRAFAAALGDDPRAALTVHAQVPFRRRKVRLDPRPWRRRNVRLVERTLPREAVLDLFRDADVAVLPSRAEGFGLTHLESLTLGVPVVTTDAPPMNELVRDGENGVLVPAREAGRHRHVPIAEVDRDALAATLLRLAADRDEVDRLKAGTGAGLPERHAAFVAGIRSEAGVGP